MAIIALYLISYFKIFLVDLALFAKVVTMNFEWHLRTFFRQIHQCTVGGFERPILALTKFGKRPLPFVNKKLFFIITLVCKEDCFDSVWINYTFCKGEGIEWFENANSSTLS